MPHFYTSKYHFSPLNYTIGSDRPLRKTIYVFFQEITRSCRYLGCYSQEPPIKNINNWAKYRLIANEIKVLSHLTAPTGCHEESTRRRGKEKASQPVSRVLSRTIIHLQLASPQTCSGLPESNASNISGFLFGLAPSGVYLATNCYQSCGALLPHHFTLT